MLASDPDKRPLRLRQRRPAMAVSWFVAAAAALALSAAGAGAKASASPSQGRLLFKSDFELGELEDLAQARITEPRFLKGWRQLYPDVRHPRFMIAALSRGAPSEAGARCLSLPLRGARALLVTRGALALAPEERVRWRLTARWDAIGSGRWGMRLLPPDTDALILHETGGDGAAWHELSGEFIVPSGVNSARLEIWLDCEPGIAEGELGIDDIVIESLPHLVWEFKDPLQRIAEDDLHPIRIRSVGLPEDTYRIDFRVLDANEQELFRESHTRIVRAEYPIQFEPEFAWAKHRLPRGAYTMVLALESYSGWKPEEHRRTFLLSGPPPFAYQPGKVEWGLEPASIEREPKWYGLARMQRLLLPFIAPPLGAPAPKLPAWFRTSNEGSAAAEPIGLLDAARGWVPEKIASVKGLVSDVHTWYWRDRAASAATAPALAEMGKLAPFVRARLSHLPEESTGAAERGVGGGEPMLAAPANAASARDLLAFGPKGERWSVRIDVSAHDPDKAAEELARYLFLLAAREPAAVYLAEPDASFLLPRPAGEVVASRALLVWDFVTAFLSGASFIAREDWDPEGHCLVYRRDGEDFVVLLGDGAPHTLSLYCGETTTSYSSAGTRWTSERDAEQRALITVARDPVLVQGLDVARIRTVRSLRSRGEAMDGGADRQRMLFEIDNHYGEAARFSLALELPRGWEYEGDFEPHRVAAGETATWSILVRVPSFFGIEGRSELLGSLEIETASGVRAVSAVAVAAPLESPLVEVRALGVGAADADILVKNRTNEQLQLNVYLATRPEGREQSWLEETLAAGAARTFRIQYDRTAGGAAELWVGVTLPEKQSYINRVFPIPAQ